MLIPKGFLRGMEGQTHRAYRDQLVRAAERTVVDVNRSELESGIASRLARFASEGGASEHPPVVMARALSAIGRTMLIQIFFGASEGSVAFGRLDKSYAEMGPDLFVWHPGEPQEQAYRDIRALLRDHAPVGECILSRMRNGGATIDETMLGNLIYMVEIGRFDLYSLFRWILKFAAENPEALIRAATDDAFAEAFVSETLRLEQAERLMRNVNRDIEFDSYFIPKGSKVRLCTWESHKSPEVFPDPFAFDPERFLQRSYTKDEYAPFGLGAHHCPMWAVTIAASRIFLQVVARTYRVEAHDDGPAFRNPFHWQPAKTFWVSLT